MPAMARRIPGRYDAAIWLRAISPRPMAMGPRMMPKPASPATANSSDATAFPLRAKTQREMFDTVPDSRTPGGVR